MSIKYVENNMLTEHALLTRELAGKIRTETGPLSLPQRTNGTDNGNGPPFDYYTSKPVYTYPDGNTCKSLYMAGVIIYNDPRPSGTNMKYPTAYPTGTVAYFEPMIKRALNNATLHDRRYASPPDLVWTEMRLYGKRAGEKGSGVQVIASHTVKGKRVTIEFDDLDDAFSKSRGAVALKANLTFTISLQAQVNKGQNLTGNEEAKIIVIPSQINVIGPVNVAQPVVNSNTKTMVNKNDDADESFMTMLMEMNAADNEDGNEEEEEEEEEEDADE